MTENSLWSYGVHDSWRKCEFCGTRRPMSLLQSVQVGEKAPGFACVEDEPGGFCQSARRVPAAKVSEEVESES